MGTPFTYGKIAIDENFISREVEKPTWFGTLYR